MPLKSKVDVIKMIHLIKEGWNDSHIARELGVSRSAITQRRKRIKKRIEHVPDLSRSELSAENIDTMKQLKHINSIIIEELQRCRHLVKVESDKQTEIEELERQVQKNPEKTDLVKELKEKTGISLSGILKIQQNLISISAEVRKQLEFQIRIAQVLYDVTMVAEFQEEVLSIVGSQAPEVRKAIIKALKERRTLRGLIKLEK